ncbi:MAG: sigma-70 family RNA polymerase sigma factor, partial [Planctomycetota bacterium]
FLAALRGGTVPVRDTGKWLRGVTRNLARKWIRAESRRRRREDKPPASVAPASPEETAERLETETALTDSVRALPEPYRTVVVLRYFDGLSTAETAARTEAPEATVKTRLRRALEMLRDRLDGRYGGRHAWLPLLIRVARPEDPVAAAATTGAATGAATLVAGGALMAKKILVVTVFAAVLAAVAVSTLYPDLVNPGPAPHGGSGEPPVVADGDVPDAATGEENASGASGTSGGIPADEAFRVVVRHFDGTPATGAKVRLLGGEVKTLGDALADEAGTAVLRATGGAAVVHVTAPGAVRERRHIDAIAGTEVVVELAEGSVISGKLLFGEAPAAGVELWLSSHDPRVGNLSVVTDSRGAFRFSGLAPGAHVSLFAGWDVTFIEPAGKNNVKLTAPATDLALRALRHPGIRGIVVDTDGKPMEGARVLCSYRARQGGGGSHRVATGPDGRFEARASVGRTPIESVRIVATTPDGTRREVLELVPTPPRPGNVDVGRIVMRAPRTFAFEVAGPESRPVTGAVVVPADDLSRASAPTDAGGRTRLTVAGGTTAVHVVASGLGHVEVPLPDDPAEPVPVRLPGGTLLTVRVKKRDGRPPLHLALEVRADARLMDGPETFAWYLFPRTGTSKPVATHQTDKATGLLFSLPMTGVVRVNGIRPGVRFRLVVRDTVADRELETRELTLDPREVRDEEFLLTIVDRTLVVVVTDHEGNPIPRAQVEAWTGRGAVSTSTTAEGRAEIPGLREEKVRVVVERRGRVPFVATYPIVDLPDELRVSLRPGRRVRLTVVGPSGKPVEPERTTAIAPDLEYAFQGFGVDEGIHDFHDLPAKPVRLLVTYAGKVHEVVADAADETARIEMPATGSVVV